MHGVHFLLSLPVQLADAAPPPIVPGLFVAVFAVLTAVGYALHSRTVGLSPPTPPVAHPSPPEERARAALAAAAPLAEIDVRAYYGCIAAAVRSYLGERYGVSSGAMTRTNAEKAMTGAGLDGRPAELAAELAAELLERCDGAQFAGEIPDRDRRSADLATAREIIELTANGGAHVVPPGSDVQRPSSV